MAMLEDIKQKITALSPGKYQNLCDAYLNEKGYSNIVSLGSKPGTEKVTKGTPDTYCFLDSDKKYIFIEYTTQQNNLYDKIMEEAFKVEKDVLFLLALGPTATVMAYDLCKAGYQAIDIGHIDVEYEWYLMGAENPVKLKNKYVCEAVNGDEVDEETDTEYLSQVIARVY